jgi:hypothetical protein
MLINFTKNIYGSCHFETLKTMNQLEKSCLGKTETFDMLDKLA